MSDNNPLPADDLERLLTDPALSQHLAARGLRALGSPALGAELIHEDAMVAAFFTSRNTPQPARGRQASHRLAIRAGTALAAILTLGTGGLALAATSHVPTPASHTAPTVVQASELTPATDEPADPEDTATGDPTDQADPTDVADTEDPETGSPQVSESADAAPTTGAPTPNLTGLCRAFQHGDRATHGKSLESAAFQVLTATAGGADGVAAYCQTLLGAPATTVHQPLAAPNRPTHPGHPLSLHHSANPHAAHGLMPAPHGKALGHR